MLSDVQLDKRLLAYSNETYHNMEVRELLFQTTFFLDVLDF